MIRHHLDASLTPCDHPMWIIWGRDRHHHTLTARRRARKRGRWSGTPLPTQGSSKATTCRRGSGSPLPAEGSSEATTCHHGSDAHLPTQGSSRGATCPRGFGIHLLAQGSSRGATCPHNSSAYLRCWSAGCQRRGTYSGEVVPMVKTVGPDS
jgi:hypothetical protein